MRMSAQSVSTTVVLGYDHLFWVCLIVLVIVLGVLALKMERDLFIVATSVCGAFVFTLSIDQLFLGGGHFNLSELQKAHTSEHNEGRLFYCLTAGAIVLALVTMLVQKKLSDRYSKPGADVGYVQPQPYKPCHHTSYLPCHARLPEILSQ